MIGCYYTVGAASFNPDPNNIGYQHCFILGNLVLFPNLLAAKTYTIFYAGRVQLPWEGDMFSDFPPVKRDILGQHKSAEAEFSLQLFHCSVADWTRLEMKNQNSSCNDIHKSAM